MAKCKVEYREPTYIVELSEPERTALVGLLREWFNEKYGDAITCETLSNISTVLRSLEQADG